VSYDCRKLNQFTESLILGRQQLSAGFGRNFTMTSPKTLYMKNDVNELSFPLVTHTTYFDTRFDRYGLLKPGYNAELFWTAWTLE
jgi:hypothetical protein